MSRFQTSEGIVVPSVTADTMREIDRIAVEETGPLLLQMMEHAGRSLADVVFPREGRVVVLAGPGGNGGGGVCAGRHLANRGFDVVVVLSAPDRLSEATALQVRIFEEAGGQVAVRPPVASVVIDALIGYSLDGAPRGAAADLIEWTAVQGSPVLSLDVPSGIDATTGGAPGARVTPDRTLTLALPKQGLDATAGELLLADLGIPSGAYTRAGIEVPSDLFAEGAVVPLVLAD